MQTFHRPQAAAQWLLGRVTGSLRTDSRRLQAGDGFLAWPGQRFDGRSQVAWALDQGVAACLIEAHDTPVLPDDARVAAYGGLKADSGAIASAYFEHPSQQLKMLAVTGTNGKTSTTWWLAQALAALPAGAVPCGLVGTLGVGVLPALRDQGLTTPDAVDLQVALAGFVQQGLQACAIEASSVGLQEQRLKGTQIHTAVFTNLTQDHLDYHGDMAAYGRAKQQLFDWPGLRAAVLNTDDAFGLALVQHLAERQAPGLEVWPIAVDAHGATQARLVARALDLTAAGLGFTACEGQQQVPVRTSLIGRYNVANVLAVLATLRSLGVSLGDAAQACSALTPVPGRMQCVRAPERALAVVDYAHTPDALSQVLQALRPMVGAPGGQLWCVFGCGGERDAAKRPLMGAVAASLADRVVLTDDNPRGESPEAIISQILLGMTGVSGVEVQRDRAQAIAQALSQSGPNDVVLIAGKGHETYQESAGHRLAFSDLEQIERAYGLPLSNAQQERQA